MIEYAIEDEICINSHFRITGSNFSAEFDSGIILLVEKKVDAMG
jgi:hypothetical protein